MKQTKLRNSKASPDQKKFEDLTQEEVDEKAILLECEFNLIWDDENGTIKKENGIPISPPVKFSTKLNHMLVKPKCNSCFGKGYTIILKPKDDTRIITRHNKVREVVTCGCMVKGYKKFPNSNKLEFWEIAKDLSLQIYLAEKFGLIREDAP